MATGATILGYIQNTLKFDRDSVGIPGLESTQLLALTNQAVLEYFDTFKNSGEPTTSLMKETGFTLVPTTQLAADVASGATSFTVDDSSSLGTSGALAIYDDYRPDYIDFTGNDLATAISGVTGVDYAHETDDQVALIYALPSDFVTFRSEEGVPSGVTLNDVPYTYTSATPYALKFSLYDNGTTKYLVFPRGSSGDAFVRYNGDPTAIDEESDTIDVPTRDEWFVVYRVCQQIAPMLDKDPSFYAVQANTIISDALKRRNIGKRPNVRPIRPRRKYFNRYDIIG